MLPPWVQLLIKLHVMELGGGGGQASFLVAKQAVEFPQVLARCYNTRRMLVIVAASRACKITFFIKRSKVRKVNHAFLPQGFQIEDLTQTSCHA